MSKYCCIDLEVIYLQVGSSARINLADKAKTTATVWKLSDTVDDDLIDSDQLLDEDDMKKPDPENLKGKGLLFAKKI